MIDFENENYFNLESLGENVIYNIQYLSKNLMENS